MYTFTSRFPLPNMIHNEVVVRWLVFTLLVCSMDCLSGTLRRSCGKITLIPSPKRNTPLKTLRSIKLGSD